MGIIAWANKIGLIPKTTRVNQVWDDDMNEIKTAVNDNFRFIGDFFVPTLTGGRQTWEVGDTYIGFIGTRLVAGTVLDNTVVLPADIDTVKVSNSLDVQA